MNKTSIAEMVETIEWDLWHAILCGDYDQVKIAIKYGADVNTFIDGASLLYIAITSKFTQTKICIIKELLSNGADPKLLFYFDNPLIFGVGGPYGLMVLPIIEMICKLPDIKEHESEYSELIQSLITEYQCSIGSAYDYALNNKLFIIVRTILSYSDEIKLFHSNRITKDECIEAIISAHQ